MTAFFHILTDILIILAYYSFPVSIYFYLKRRKTLQLKPIYWLLILFIFSYGTTHLLHILGLWASLDWAGVMAPVIVTIVVSVLLANDLQQVNASLQEERDFASAILETLDAFVIVLDAGGNVLKLNPSFERLTGRTSNEVEGTNFTSVFLSPCDAEEVTKIMNDLKNQEKPSRYENHITAQNGDSYFISWSNTALKAADGSVKYIICSGIDITERRQAEDVMRKTKNYFKDTLKDTLRQHRGMIAKIKKERGYFVYTLADGQLLYRLGLSPDQVVGKGPMELFRSIEGLSEEDAISCIDFYRRAWQGEEDVRFEWISLSGIDTVTVLNPIKINGKVTELISSTTDITKEKQMAKELQQSEEKYRLMAENITDLLIILDPQGNTQYASPSHQRILGYQPDQLIGKSRFTLLHPDDLSSMKEWFKTICHADQAYKAEYRLGHRDGHWILVEARGMPILNDQGTVERIVLIVRDITDQKQTEEMIRKWERVSVVGELAAGIAHEIRNPLTTLKGFVQLLKRGGDNPQHLDLMHSELSRIELVTNELLMLGKPQALKYHTQNLTSILESVITILNTQAIISNTHIRMDVELDHPSVYGDSNHLKQVFINLLKNAIEAMPHGGEIVVKVQPSDNKVIIRFIDQGIGIPKELLPKLGEPFYSLKEKGTGLGLMISFKIIKEHNGDLNIVSCVGEGTTVIVSLPLIGSEANPELGTVPKLGYY